jgi:hypothetical protein
MIGANVSFFAADALTEAWRPSIIGIVKCPKTFPVRVDDFT